MRRCAHAAMSTTRSTPDQQYTIVGGAARSGTATLPAVVLLNREARISRPDALAALERCGFDSVVSVEGPSPQYDVERLISSFPGTRFLILRSPLSLGAQINLALAESNARYVLVTWSSMQLRTPPKELLDRLAARSLLCAVPTIRDERSHTLPTAYAPAFYGRLLRIVPTQPSREETLSLFPHEFCGIYDRERFRLLGGYDSQITNEYWQKLDFGFRAWMWGETIASLSGFELEAPRAAPAEDTTIDEGYAIFHLKNLAIRFARDVGRLPLRKLGSYITRSGVGPIESVRRFTRIRRWVRANRYRFTQDARRVTELWEVEE